MSSSRLHQSPGAAGSALSSVSFGLWKPTAGRRVPKDTSNNSRSSSRAPSSSEELSGERCDNVRTPSDLYTSLVSRIRAPRNPSARRRRGSSRARSSPMLVVSAPSDSEESRGHWRVARRSANLSDHRLRSTSLLQRAQRRKSSVLVRAHTCASYARRIHRRALSSPMTSPSGATRSSTTRLTSRKLTTKPRRARKITAGRFEGSKTLSPLTRKNKGSRTTLRAPQRHGATPRGHSAPIRPLPRSRKNIWRKNRQSEELDRNRQHTNNSLQRSEEHLSLSPEVGQPALEPRRPPLLAVRPLLGPTEPVQ